MGKSRSSWKHALPVLSPYAPVPGTVTSTAQSVMTERLFTGRDVKVRPLTAPSRTEAGVQSSQGKKKKRKKDGPTEVKKVGLGVLAWAGGERSRGSSLTAEGVGQNESVNGNMGGGTALKDSIKAVLQARPVVKLAEQMDKERRELEERVGKQKLAAGELKRLMRENEKEEEEERMREMEVVLVEDDEEDDEDEMLVISCLETGRNDNDDTPTLDTSIVHSNELVSAGLTSSNSINGASAAVLTDIVGPNGAAPTQHLPSTPSTSDPSRIDILQAVDYMDLDALDELFSEESSSPPQNATSFSSPLASTSSSPTTSLSPRVEISRSPPFLTKSSLPIVSPPDSPSTSTSSVAHSLLAPSSSSAASTSTSTTLTSAPLPALPSALPLIQHRTRKPKKIIPVEFDYQSSGEEDWEPLPSVRSWKTEGRPRHGRALQGDDLSYLPGATLKAFSADPDLLPASKAHAEKLVPKNYQTALLERAKVQNIITVLPTGSGKTLVAVMFVEWIYQQELKRVQETGGRKRMTFFLTNSVPLVHQQANILVHNSNVKVGKLFGALGVNLSSKEEWDWSFENYDCLVLTAQLLLDSLAHGFIDMSQINLLVFDEAHHAKSNHPFASILRDFYARSVNRPRILGLTASPLSSNQGLDEADRLQTLFDAKLVTAPQETLIELEKMVAKPEMLCFNYDPPPAYYPSKLTVKIFEAQLVQDEEFIRIANEAEGVLKNHGPDASDLFWKLEYLRSLQRLTKDKSKLQVIEVLPEVELDPEFSIIHPHAAEQDALVKELEKGKENEDDNVPLADWMKVVQDFKLEIQLLNLSPKLQTLVKVLEVYAHMADDFCGIVFCKRRLDTLIISQLLRYMARVRPNLKWLKVDCVTGHGGGLSLGPKMQWAEQADVLNQFGEGKLNLIIATSVVEEGLDVQPCNFVLRFDLYETHISFVQSRGRARRKDGSHYIHLIEKGNTDDRKRVIQIQELEKGMGSVLDSIENAQGDDDSDESEDECEEYLENPVTGALLTPHFCLSLLHRYSQSLPRSDNFHDNSPRYEIDKRGPLNFVCVLQLPASSRLRRVISPVCKSGKAAKRQSSFIACKLLHQLGALDDHFLPMRSFVEPEVKDAEGRTLGSSKRQILYEKKYADDWTIQQPFSSDGHSTLYATVLKFPGPNGTMLVGHDFFRPLLLLSRNRLTETPPLNLYLRGQRVLVTTQSVDVPFAVTPEQRHLLTRYNVKVFEFSLNRTFAVDADEILYFVAPLVNSQSLETPITLATIDWDVVERGASGKEESLDIKNLTGLEDSIVVDAGKNNCRYSFKAVHPDLHPSSKLPPGRQSDAGFENVLDYYKSFNDRVFHPVHINESQPLLEVNRIPKVVNYLTPTPRNLAIPSKKQLLETTPRFAIPQLCSKHCLPHSLFRTHLLLPSILTELDQLLLVQELNSRIFKGRIDPALVRVALSTPSACLAEDYQRLELLGDGFLKWLASVYCFVSLDKTAHEGDLHHTRLKHVQNATLFKAGVKLNLPAYLVSKPRTPKRFVPPNFTLARGRPPTMEAEIGDKTIADVCEALLGAAYETGFARGGLQGGFELALEAALALKMDLVGVSCWADMAKLYGEIPSSPRIVEEPTLIEQKLNYRFVHPHLLTEALTHPSKVNAVASFQRLEWLGDSVCDFLVIRWIWNQWGGCLPPGHLTELKGAMVSNETFAAIAIVAELDRYLSFDSVGLRSSIEVYRKRLDKARETELLEAAAEVRELRPYWLLLDAPKAVADIIESLFGAILVDSGFNPQAVQDSFDHLLLPFYTKWISPTSLRIDAIRQLLETAQAAACEDVSHISSTVDGRVTSSGEVVPRATRTSVISHDHVLATVQLIHSKTAKRIVSADALAFLQQNPSFFAEKCDCAARRAERMELRAELMEQRRNEGLIESDDDESDDDVPRKKRTGGHDDEGAGLDQMDLS